MDSNILGSKFNSEIFASRRIFSIHRTEYSAAILLDNEDIITFNVESVNVGHWFEVFPLSVCIENPQHALSWTSFKPIDVISIGQLWREEWQQEVDNAAQFIGSGPHYLQCSAPLGHAPSSATNVVRVLAGILLVGHDGRKVIACSSVTNVFNVDLTADGYEIEKIMLEHTCL